MNLKVAIVSNQTRRAPNVVSDLSTGLGSQLLHPVANSSDIGNALQRHQVSSEASNVGAGHGGAAEGISGSVAGDADAQDVDTGGKDINAGAKVGERSAGISALINGSDGDSGRGGARRGVGSVLVLVTGRDNGDDTRGGDLVDGGVDGARAAAAEGHIHDGLAAELLGGGGVGHKLHTLENTGVGAGAVGIEDLDGDDVGLLANPEDRAGYCPSYVTAVPVFVGVDVVDEVGTEGGAAFELGVGDADAGVNDEDGNSFTS